MTDAARIASDAARSVGLNHGRPELIRHGSNALYRLPDGVVARVGPAGSTATARREADASRRLADAGIPVVRTIDVEQPAVVDDHPVTFWHELPPHRPATPAELATVLRTLHHVSPPTDWHLPPLDPFAHLADRIDAAPPDLLDADSRGWLAAHLDHLRQEWDELPPGLPVGVVHGDAWQDNVAVPLDGGDPTLLDLEHLALGRPEWDLSPIAADHVDFDRLDAGAYQSFAHAYGHDVTTWGGFRTVADTQELRWLCFALEIAVRDPGAAKEAAHRIACLRGDIPKPWTWAAL